MEETRETGMVERIGQLRVSQLKLLKETSPFQEKYEELIELEKKETRKVLDQIEQEYEKATSPAPIKEQDKSKPERKPGE